MILKILICITFCFIIFGLGYNKGHKSIMFYHYGHCYECSDFLDHETIKNKHKNFGKLYPVPLNWGELVPPGNEPTLKDDNGIVWMCGAHAAKWLGRNPETGEICKWGILGYNKNHTFEELYSTEVGYALRNDNGIWETKPSTYKFKLQENIVSESETFKPLEIKGTTNNE